MTHQYMEIKMKELEKRIEMLEKEPCKDLISRADAIDACNQSINLFEAVDRIKELPRK